MLIPSIDLQGGKIVQLVQGERLAVETSDIESWIAKFSSYSKVQLIDLDAAKGAGGNEAVVARICGALPCRVGGGIRSIERASTILGLGATKVILGSSLFRGNSVNVAFAENLSAQIGPERLIAAVDGKGGRVVVNGWRTSLDITPAQAIRMLEPFFDEFLYTHVDLEGLMKGTDMDAIRALRATTTRALTAAGGITTREEIDELAGINVDAVVGMAVYTGRLKV
jgi:phosphoribosylformimino-5-aminoimidazole carboxamide ribotide isomerase